MRPIRSGKIEYCFARARPQADAQQIQAPEIHRGLRRAKLQLEIHWHGARERETQLALRLIVRIAAESSRLALNAKVEHPLGRIVRVHRSRSRFVVPKRHRVKHRCVRRRDIEPPGAVVDTDVMLRGISNLAS